MAKRKVQFVVEVDMDAPDAEKWASPQLFFEDELNAAVHALIGNTTNTFKKGKDAGQTRAGTQYSATFATVK